MSTSAHMSDSIEDTKCCPTFNTCRKATNLIKYYTQCRKEGKYHWLKYTMQSTNRVTWSFKEGPKCKIFWNTPNIPNYITTYDGEPELLAYVDLYAPENVTSGRFGSLKSETF